MSEATTESYHPPHLDPSELGTKEYWDSYYQNDLNHTTTNDDDDGDEEEDDNDNDTETQLLDPSDLESWFDDVNAPTKILEYLTSPNFPLSPANSNNNSHASSPNPPSILDLGTGNGSMLFTLKLEGGYSSSRMIGVDYSQSSVDLARKLWQKFRPSSDDDRHGIRFEKLDVIRETPQSLDWWPSSSSSSQTKRHRDESSGDDRKMMVEQEEGEKGFDLVLDKGTFDAISLADEEIVVTDTTTTTNTEENGGQQQTTIKKRICEIYPQKVVEMVRPGGFFLVTSCNWTEDEVIRWFDGVEDDSHRRKNGSSGGGRGGKFEVFGRIEYPVYEFGGKKGQGVASVCFRKV